MPLVRFSACVCARIFCVQCVSRVCLSMPLARVSVRMCARLFVCVLGPARACALLRVYNTADAADLTLVAGGRTIGFDLAAFDIGSRTAGGGAPTELCEDTGVLTVSTRPIARTCVALCGTLRDGALALVSCTVAAAPRPSPRGAAGSGG